MTFPTPQGDIIKYIDANELVVNKWEVRNIRNKVLHYTLLEGILYRRGYSSPLLRCVSFEKAQYVLAKVNEGICGDHSRGKVLDRGESRSDQTEWKLLF
ncbi:hypothetical protein I3842_15G091700 [Carya illinoinensis]|uniref:Uncharacterized protein n=1 Tax=Carya illinoinensis TaxID=32201 RepID=A0A922D210_CARIL|nr:hypothetical protein I3842_15G091700 [Carya illinoinensis]